MRSLLFLLFVIFFIFIALPVVTYLVPLYYFQQNYNQIEQAIIQDLFDNSFYNNQKVESLMHEWQEYQLNKNVYKLIPVKYQRFVLKFCSTHEIPVNYIYSTFQWESGWSENCIGYNKDSIDINIPQLNSKWMWSHARGFFKSEQLIAFNPWNWKHALEVGMGLLNYYYKNYHGDIKHMLVAYNAGTYYVDKDPPASTKIYVKKIQAIIYSI